MVLRAENITALLHAVKRGDPSSAEQLVNVVYSDLKKVARRYMAAERPDHTLQPTALVNDALMRLLKPAGEDNALHSVEIDWQSRAHFLGVAARQMRLILIDHARNKRATKRALIRIPIEDVDPKAMAVTPDLDIETIDRLLTLLATKDEAAAKVIELKFFGGLTDREAAEVLGVSLIHVRRDWEFARSWLRRRLGAPSTPPENNALKVRSHAALSRPLSEE